MANYRLTSYRGIDISTPSSELRHWKYIKKVKKNGKWRYYYDVGQKERRIYKTAKKNSEIADTDVKLKTIIAETARAGVQSAFTKKRHEEALKTYKKASDDLAKSWQKSNEAQEKEQAAKNAYYKTPIGKIAKASAKVVNFVKGKLASKVLKNNSYVIVGKDAVDAMLKKQVGLHSA